MAEPKPTLIYLDTNVYARPFDDQTQPAIQAEANAFLAILAAVKAGRLALLSSGILAFEVAQILSQDKRDKIEEYLLWCGQHIAQSDEVLDLGGLLESRCRIRTRDALHVASALLGGARYFLSCDRQITEMKQARCYRRLAPPTSGAYFSAMKRAPLRAETEKRRNRMNTSTTLPNETADLMRKGWKVLVEHLGLPQATQFVVLLERGKGDSVAEIKEYWGDASIDEIHARIMQWQEQRT